MGLLLFTPYYRWPARAVERFQGPWNHKLANPILIIGNRGDAITPLSSAKQIADLLGNSAALLTRDGYGVCSVCLKLFFHFH